MIKLAFILFYSIVIVFSLIGVLAFTTIYSNALSFKYAFENNIYCTEKYPGGDRDDCLVTKPVYQDPLPKFNLNDEDFDQQTSRFGTFMLKSLYADDIKNDSIKRLNLTLKKIINIRQHKQQSYDFCGIWEDQTKTKLFIICTGTVGIYQWLQNLHVNQYYYNQDTSIAYPSFMKDNHAIKVHKGFLMIYSDIIERLHNVIKQYTKKGLELYFVGHSMGGAIATILSKEYNYNGYTTCCYSFGSPRIGNGSFCDGTKNLVRVVNTEDIIPQTPTSVTPNFIQERIPFIYSHCGYNKNFSTNLSSLYNNHSIYLYDTF